MWVSGKIKPPHYLKYMNEEYLKELVRLTRKNTFYTGGGFVTALAALIISLIALLS
jgi:hypothetical protein